MWSKRLKELFAVITIGDGVVLMVAPTRHFLLWMGTGPKTGRKLARFLADNPNYARLLGLTQVAYGVWLALQQYEEG